MLMVLRACVLCVGLMTVVSWVFAGNEPDPKVTSTATDATGDEASDEVPEGHSFHGAFLNEGPRQGASLMGGTGAVDFPVTTDHPEAQDFITQGVGQLYGFWYLEAERSFRQAAAIDNDCAMAYWGAALATLQAPERARGFIAEAMQRRKDVTKRERMYIEALDAYLKVGQEKEEAQKDQAEDAEAEDDEAEKKKKLTGEQKEKRAREYTKALEAIAIDYPDDIEAKAFLALQLWLNKRDLPNPSYLAVDGLLDRVFAAQPMHPAHHFRIHHWDHRKPELALDSAAKCGPSAPSIAHMWHMPGHIYSRLHRYHDACWQQEASARVDHAHMMRDRVMPDQIHNFAHNNEWLIRNLRHVGRVGDALSLAKNMISLPQHPKFNTLDKRSSASYGRRRLIETLEQFELWDQAVSLCHSAALPPTDDEEQQVARLRLLGTALAMTAGPEAAQPIVADLQARIEATKTEEEAAEDKKEKKKLKSTREALQRTLARLQTFVKIAEADVDAALATAKQAGNTISPLLKARWQLQAGDPRAAFEAVEKEIKKSEGEVLPLATMVELRHAAGQWTEATDVLEQLAGLASAVDMAAPVFQRVDSIAQQLAVDFDWHPPRTKPEDFGPRPELDSLGPFRWQPSPAPSWKLSDAAGQPHVLDSYSGRPVLVIFYLGAGCLHCAEQLQAFAPQAETFEEAGIEIVAISSENQDDLKLSVDLYDDKPLPFQLLCDPQRQTFKSYRAYDDFEDQPLHGTFLIDAEGRIRWQDIGYEPFMDVDFVLTESQRLLAQPK